MKSRIFSRHLFVIFFVGISISILGSASCRYDYTDCSTSTNNLRFYDKCISISYYMTPEYDKYGRYAPEYWWIERLKFAPAKEQILKNGSQYISSDGEQNKYPASYISNPVFRERDDLRNSRDDKTIFMMEREPFHLTKDGWFRVVYFNNGQVRILKDSELISYRKYELNRNFIELSGVK